MIPETRWSTAEDAEALAHVHSEAWRFAYAGMLPGMALERRIALHGPAFWRGGHDRGRRVRVITVDGALAGYAFVGPARAARWRGRTGEIYELYLDPVWHGAGLGARLFGDARETLKSAHLRATIVWSLADNEAGCRFYASQGGEKIGESWAEMGGRRLKQLGFGWR